MGELHDKVLPECSDPSDEELAAAGEAFEPYQQKALYSQIKAQREAAERREQIAELRQLLTAEERRRELYKVIRECAPLIEIPPFERVKQPRKSPRNVWLLTLSDIHGGQLTELPSTGGMFMQSSEVTTAQFARLKERLAWLHNIALNGTKVEEIVLLLAGDLIDGDGMRRSQARKIDKLAAKQALDMTRHLTDLIRFLLSRFEKVTVRIVGGNHDRLSEKAGDAGLGEYGYEDTWAYVIGGFLEISFEEIARTGRIDLVNHDSWFGGLMIEGLRTVYEHGASFRASTGSYGGVSYYSIANAASQYQLMLGGADLVVMGHHHTPMVLPMADGRGWQIMNGSFPPSSTYVQSGMKKYRRPAQILTKLHADYGLIGWEPLYLDIPEYHSPPGTFWERMKETA